MHKVIGSQLGGTPYSGPYWEAPPERGTFFRLPVYERDLTLVEVYERVENSNWSLQSVIGPKGANRGIL